MFSQYPRLSPGYHAFPYMVSVCENNYVGFTTWEMIAQRELSSQRFSLMAEQVTEPRQLPSLLLNQAHV